MAIVRPWLRAVAAISLSSRCWSARRRISRVQQRKIAGPAAIRDIFNALDRAEAQRLLDRFIDQYRQNAPKPAERACPKALPFSSCQQPTGDDRTTNALECVNKEIKRRTRVATLFPNEASFLRLVSAVAMEISEEWITGRVYLNIHTDSV